MLGFFLSLCTASLALLAGMGTKVLAACWTGVHQAPISATPMMFCASDTPCWSGLPSATSFSRTSANTFMVGRKFWKDEMRCVMARRVDKPLLSTNLLYPSSLLPSRTNRNEKEKRTSMYDCSLTRRQVNKVLLDFLEGDSNEVWRLRKFLSQQQVRGCLDALFQGKER